MSGAAIPLSNIARSMSQSPIRSMTELCRRFGGINLAQGLCDTEPPAPVIEAASEAFRSGKNSYSSAKGVVELREAIAAKEDLFKGVHCDPHGEIVVTSGTTGAFYAALMATLNPGDEVILFEPYYGYHAATLASMGVNMRYVRLHAPGWKISKESLEAVVNDKTKAIVITNPGNPTGKVFTREELQLLGEVIADHSLFLISDEIYEHFVYDGAHHVSPLQIPSLRDRTIVVKGFSKSFCLTGWRVGYLICPPSIGEAITAMSDLFYVCAPTPLQYGAANGIWKLTHSYYEELQEAHKIKRDILCSALSESGFSCTTPQGAYYTLAEIGMEGSSLERAESFLRLTGVAGVPGMAFYHDDAGDSLCRFCFAASKDQIVQAARQIRDSRR